LERAAGPYYIIPDFRKFLDKLNVVISDPLIETNSELYNDSRKEGIMASFKVEQDLMEWEANLWEY